MSTSELATQGADSGRSISDSAGSDCGLGSTTGELDRGSGAKKFYLSIIIERHIRVEALLDTGADITLMSAELLEEVQEGAKRTSRTLKLQRCELNQVTDTAPNSRNDGAVSEPRPEPSSSSKDQDPLLCSLQEPESNAGPLRIMTAIDVHGTSVSDATLALWAENSAISLKLFRILKQRHQSLPHVARHSRFPLSSWSTTMATSKIVCAVDIRWNNRHLSYYFLVVPDLPHDIYIGADIIVRLNACIDTVNDIIWAPPSCQLTTSVNLKNLQSGQTMPDACAMITEQEATIPAYRKSVSVRLSM
ncbi:hypothetical protein G5714_018003 [Onychostoma macrolepis]|uniref:Peptidase A2 domain-containing protein n=1 Tax=Onychostoma macrolepis TaxID=369639 RepID=A0A7J6C3D6_9TELE|nr:hypothetical protein G5714_018003 [Onychostoma macrolepis]